MTDLLSRIPSGLRYFFGREARIRRAIEATALAVFEGWSYEEITTPAVDYYSLFEQGMGNEASNSFRFMDTDGRLIALRPDVTSGVARAAVTLLKRRERPLRLWYVAPVFRQHAKSQAEFRREFTQIGCELFGATGDTADVEVLAMACEVFERLGLGSEFVITLCDVEVFNGVAENLGLDSAQRGAMRELVDDRNATDLETFLSRFASPADSRRFAELTQLSGKSEVFAAARRVITNDRSRAALDRLKALWKMIESLDLTDRFEIDLGDVSELDYYTALNFKIYVKGAGVRIGGGGRYDNLAAKLGQAEPAIGFVLDLDALTDVLIARDENQFGADPLEAALRITSDDSIAMFREALRARVQGERVVIEAREVKP
jgi:ATP phosphoribosyltransferase regulatory subunit